MISDSTSWHLRFASGTFGLATLTSTAGTRFASFQSMTRWVRRWGRLPVLLLGAFSFVAVSACATTFSLDEVMKDPGRYRGRRVMVSGVVTSSGSIAGRGLYRIRDGESQLWVASESGVPTKGTRVLVSGRIYDAYDLRGLPVPMPDSVASGVVLLESSRATE